MEEFLKESYRLKEKVLEEFEDDERETIKINELSKQFDS